MIDSSVTIAGQKLFHLQGDRSHSLPWEKYGFILHCPKGAVSKDTEVAVTALVSGSFKVPKGTVLVSAVYAISVSKPLLKSLTIELQHCVDLRNTGQTGRLKFVRGPLKSPYQLSPVEGGVFRIRNRYGSIERDEFCAVGIAAEMSNEGTPILVVRLQMMLKNHQRVIHQLHKVAKISVDLFIVIFYRSRRRT